MKFFKVIVALCVLLGIQNGVFGLGAKRGTTATTATQTQTTATQGGTKLQQAVDMAVSVFNAYINKTASERTQEDLQKADKAVQLMRAAQGQGVQLTTAQVNLMKRVIGALEVDTVRLNGGQAGTTATTVATASTGASARGFVGGVKRGGATRATTTTKVTPNAKKVTSKATRVTPNATTTTATGPRKGFIGGVKRGAVRTAATTVTEKPVETVVTAQDARKVATEKLNQTIQFWFGEGDLLNLFIGVKEGGLENASRSVKVNNAKLMQAFERVELFRKQASLSVEDVFDRIMKAVRSNQQSRLSVGQQEILFAEMDRLFKVELEKEVPVATPIITPEMDLSVFFLSNGSLNMPMVYKAFDKIQMYQQTYNVTKQQVLNMVANNILKNETITVPQRNILVSKMNELIIGEATEVGGVQQGVKQIEGPGFKQIEGPGEKPFYIVNGKFNLVAFTAGTFAGDLKEYFAGGQGLNIGMLMDKMGPALDFLLTMPNENKLNDEAYLTGTYLELNIKKNTSITPGQAIILTNRVKDMIDEVVRRQQLKLREEEQQGQQIGQFFQ